MLLEEYEDRVHPLPKADPGKMLAYLLEEHGLRPADLAGVLPKSRVSEILTGRRAVSKLQGKGLAEFFRVPVELFLEPAPHYLPSFPYSPAHAPSIMKICESVARKRA